MLELARWTRANSSYIQERGMRDGARGLCVSRPAVTAHSTTSQAWRVPQRGAGGLCDVLICSTQPVIHCALIHCAKRVACSLVSWDVRRWTSDAQKCLSRVSGGTTWHAFGVFEGARQTYRASFKRGDTPVQNASTRFI
jgi:hypothetical protein